MKKTTCFFNLLLLCAFSKSIAVEYQDYPSESIKGSGSYLDFVSKVDKSKVKTVFEIGSGDAKDAIELSSYFKCHVYAFECAPYEIELCKSNIGLNPNVTLIPMGVWDTSGENFFYRIPNWNKGTSSFFEFNPEAINYPEVVAAGLIQERITVPCIRLDEFLEENDIENIDLLCMDVKGASFQVLNSLGGGLKKVKYIILELDNDPIYLGEVLYEEVDKYLTIFGFVRASQGLDPYALFGDVFYINSHLRVD